MVLLHVTQCFKDLSSAKLLCAVCFLSPERPRTFLWQSIPSTCGWRPEPILRWRFDAELLAQEP